LTILLLTIEISRSIGTQNPDYTVGLSGAFGLGLAAYKTATPAAATMDIPVAGRGCQQKSKSAR
jgi:hypothetical protein